MDSRYNLITLRAYVHAPTSIRSPPIPMKQILRPIAGVAVAFALTAVTPAGPAGAQPALPACPPASQGASTPSGTPMAVPPQGTPTPTEEAQLVACVGAEAITAATFLQWARVARAALPGSPKHRQAASKTITKEVMGFLISSGWVIEEARARGIALTEAQVRHEFDRIRDEQFPRLREFAKFLRQSKQTVADLLLRVRLNLLSQQIQKAVLAGVKGKRAQAMALGQFVSGFKDKWMAQTYCAPAYAVADCGHVQESL
jgi:hypothetical protein